MLRMKTTSGIRTVVNRARPRAGTLPRTLLCALVLLNPVMALAEMVALDEESPALSGRLFKSSSWPAGKVALLLHGTLSHRDTEIIQSLESLLGDEDVSTLAINLSLGVEARDGAFDCAATHRHREQDAAAELARWHAWLRAQGVTDLTLIGHSRGANQVARFVLSSEGAVGERMVLIAPPRWTEAGAANAYAARNGEALTPLLDLAERQVAAGKGDALIPRPLGLLYCPRAAVSAESFLSYYAPEPLRDTPTLLSRIDLPTLVIAGSEDTIAANLVAAFDNSLPHVRVVEIDGADHFFRDLYADEMVDVTVEFMHESD